MKYFFIFITILLFPLTQLQSEELTLDQCIDLAIKNNNRLKIFGMDVNISEQEKNIAFKEFLPAMKLRGHYLQLDKPDRIVIEKDAFSSGIPFWDVELYGERKDYGLQLSIEQPIFTGGKLTHSYNRSKLFHEQTQLRAQREEKLLRFDVIKAFSEALKEKFYLKIMEKIIESKKERLRVANERLKEGYLQKEDLLILETDLANAELEFEKAKNRESFYLSRLRRLIYSDDETLSIKGDLENFSFILPLDDVKEISKKNREDFKILQTRIKKAEEDIGIAKSGFYPKISVMGGYTRQNETITARPEVWKIMTQMEWTIFDWNKTKLEVSKAEISKKKLLYEKEELKRAIMLETEDAWRTLKVIEKEVETRKKILITSEFRYNQRLEQYAEGKVKIEDLIDTEKELIKSYNEYLITLVELNLSLANLENSVSTSLKEWCVKKEIYKPDFERFLKRKEEMIFRKPSEEVGFKKENIFNLSEEREDIFLDLTPINSEPKLTTNFDSKTEIKKTIINEPKDSYLVLQVGAFKNRKNAEKQANYFIGKVGNERVKIEYEKNFYKVLIFGFKDKIGIESFLKVYGIKNYLIKK